MITTIFILTGIFIFICLSYCCLCEHKHSLKKGIIPCITFIIMKLLLLDKFFNFLICIFSKIPGIYRINNYFIYSRFTNSITQCINRTGFEEIRNKSDIYILNRMTNLDFQNIKKYKKIIFTTNPSIFENTIRILKHKGSFNDSTMYSIKKGKIIKANQIFERIILINYLDFCKELITNRKNLIKRLTKELSLCTYTITFK